MTTPIKQHEPAFPANVEAEEGVLGSLIIDPDALPLIADRLAPDDFFRDSYRTIYEAMLTLAAAHTPADFITLCDALEQQGALERVGGAAIITALMNGVPTSGNVAHYAHIVRQKAIYRRLIHAAGQIAAWAYQEEADALEQAERLILGLGRQGSTGEATHISALMGTTIPTLVALHERHQQITGIPTGYQHVDAALSGLQPSDLIVLAARPRVGKTSLALNIAAHAAYQHEKRVLVFSLEMSKEQLALRLLAMQARINQQRLRLGWVDDEQWEAVMAAAALLSKGTLWIDDTGGLSLTALESRARRLQSEQGLDLLIVDYLQLMHAQLDGKRFSVREQEIAEISRGLKALAKELNVPVLALAQLNRAVEGRQSKVPMLSDLRESGAIENDADVVLFLHREELYDGERMDAKGMADLYIAKHRNGPEGVIRLGFEASQTRFYDLEVTSCSSGEED